MKFKYLPISTLLLVSFFLFAEANAQVVSAFAGTGSAGYTGDGGPAVSAECSAPAGVAVYGGVLYFCDLGNNVIRKIDASGVITTIAGSPAGTTGYTGDGGPATAALVNNPSSIAVDDTGNIYFTDDANNVVREITTAGLIYTVAGNYAYGAGYSGDGGPATDGQLNRPTGIAIDKLGNIYIADTYNHVVREVRISANKIITIAGIGGVPGNGASGYPAVITSLDFPKGVAVDTGLNVFVLDQGNDLIRRVEYTTSNMYNYAGNDSIGYSGDGGYGTSAKLNVPTGIALDAGSNLYIADYNNHVIRKEKPDGQISTYAGTGSSGNSGNGGPATSATFSGPYGIAIDNTGSVYLSDELNNNIRKIGFTTGTAIVSPAGGTLQVFPNPTTGACTINLPFTAASTSIYVTDLLGKSITIPGAQATGDQQLKLDLTMIPSGCYLLRAANGSESYHTKVVVIR